MSEEATSPQKRVPIRYGDIPDEEERAGMDEAAWSELKGIIERESVTFRDTGKLSSPATSPMKGGSGEGSGGNGGGGGGSVEGDGAVPTKEQVEAVAAKRYYLPFHSLYSALSEAGVGPDGHPGLVALHAAVEAESKMKVYWGFDISDRKQRIAMRVRALEEEARAHTEAMAQLLKAQRRAEPRPPGGRPSLAPAPGPEPGGVNEDALQQWRDERRLGQLEEEAAATAHQNERRRQQATVQLEAAKLRIEAERAARRIEREERLALLKEQEEASLETLEATSRVRGRWDKAKREVIQTGDVTKLDEY